MASDTFIFDEAAYGAHLLQGSTELDSDPTTPSSLSYTGVGLRSLCLTDDSNELKLIEFGANRGSSTVIENLIPTFGSISLVAARPNFVYLFSDAGFLYRLRY